MKLKPCPFCGGEANIAELIGAMDLYPTVQCSVCNSNSGLCMTVKDAIETWNRRGE